MANTLVKGTLTGLVYGLMALGLSVIFGVVRVVNFAHGEMMVVGMYGAWLLAVHAGLDPLLAMPVMAALLFAGGYLLQRGLINRFVTRPEHVQFLLLVAVAMILANTALMLFGPDARTVQVDYAFDSILVGPLILDLIRIYAAGFAILLTLLLFAFFRFTLTGKAIRAAADNLLGAQVIGLDHQRLYALTFGIGAAAVGAGGCLMLLLIDATPMIASDFTILGFIIVILGGLGSLMGALVGGILIGVSEALAGTLIEPSMKSMVSFGLLILVLLIRPQGLFGRRG
ncbi:MAG: branched-chain amino acid ABC transporter permease [Alphaproteobacteria bacterium]|nr:MAG: branched-chain amino acid ABC transporter permease [Alphaproteobacteria bacterium]